MKRYNNFLWFLGSVAVAVAMVGAWQLVADARLISPAFLPGPDRTFAALFRSFDNGTIYAPLLGTVRRMLFGWVIASCVGVLIGSLVGTSRVLRTLLAPTIEFFRPIPASALMPVAILFLGLSEGMVVTTIAYGAIWPVFLGTLHGVTVADTRLREVARLLGLGRVETMWKIILPGAMPSILTGIRLGLTASLILTVVGEMLASRPGLGMGILLDAHAFKAPDLYAGVMMLGAMGFLVNFVIQRAERYLLRWR